MGVEAFKTETTKICKKKQGRPCSGGFIPDGWWHGASGFIFCKHYYSVSVFPILEYTPSWVWEKWWCSLSRRMAGMVPCTCHWAMRVAQRLVDTLERSYQAQSPQSERALSWEGGQSQNIPKTPVRPSLLGPLVRSIVCMALLPLSIYIAAR